MRNLVVKMLRVQEEVFEPEIVDDDLPAIPSDVKALSREQMAAVKVLQRMTNMPETEFIVKYFKYTPLK